VNICEYIVTCLVEYQDYRTAIPKKLGKGVSAVMDMKLIANKCSHSNEPRIAPQHVTICDPFTVHPSTLKPDPGVSWSSGRASQPSQFELGQEELA
jgi:hypothetical protein